MNLRSKMVLGAATFALACGLSGIAQAADPAPAPATPAAPAMTPAPTAGTPLADVQNPKQTLVGAKVKDSKGEALGEVKSVKLGTDGKVASVSVGIGAKTYALQADSLTYAEADKTLTSAKSKAEFKPSRNRLIQFIACKTRSAQRRPGLLSANGIDRMNLSTAGLSEKIRERLVTAYHWTREWIGEMDDIVLALMVYALAGIWLLYAI